MGVIWVLMPVHILRQVTELVPVVAFHAFLCDPVVLLRVRPRVRDRCQCTVGQIEGREIIFALSLCADTIHDFTFQRCDVLLADFAVFDEVAGETSLKIVVRVREPAGVGARELSPVLGFRGGLDRKSVV